MLNLNAFICGRNIVRVLPGNAHFINIDVSLLLLITCFILLEHFLIFFTFLIVAYPTLPMRDHTASFLNLGRSIRAVIGLHHLLFIFEHGFFYVLIFFYFDPLATSVVLVLYLHGV